MLSFPFSIILFKEFVQNLKQLDYYLDLAPLISPALVMGEVGTILHELSY